MTTESQRTEALAWLRRRSYRFPLSGSRSGASSTRESEFMNRILCRIETYSNNVQALPRGAQNAAQNQLNDLLGAESLSNWRGLDNMGSSLVRIHSTGGLFRDSGTSTYTGGLEKVFPYSLEANDTFVYFARALDEKLENARASLLDYNSTFNELAERVAIANPDQSNWDQVKSAFRQVKATQSIVESYGWLLAYPLQQIAGYARSQEVMTHISGIIRNRTLNNALGIFDILSAIDSSARTPYQLREAAGISTSASSNEAISQLSNLLGGLRLVCHFLPILSNFYESMFDGIPGLIGNFRTAIDRTNRSIVSAGVSQGDSPSGTRGLHGMIPQALPPAVHRSPCRQCGCIVQRPCV